MGKVLYEVWQQNKRKGSRKTRLRHVMTFDGEYSWQRALKLYARLARRGGRKVILRELTVTDEITT